MNLRNHHHVLFLPIIILFFLIGFLGPNFWIVPQPIFSFKVIQNNISNPKVSIKRLNQFRSDYKYLSSDQFEDKKVVFQWSELILNNVKNNLYIPRMYFPFIPKNIGQYEIDKKKSIFIAILLPIALRGNELVLKKEILKIAFFTIIYTKLSIFQKMGVKILK